MFPLQLEAVLGHWQTNLLYIACGFLFGFVLEQAGFGNSRNLAAQFYLYDMRVLKVMFTAIVTAMLLIFLGQAVGLLDYSQLFINPTHLWPGIVGGLIFGVGFVIGGYCPGTSIVSAATLKIDGMFFLLGLVLGSVVFAETVGWFQGFFDSAGFYGELTLPQLLGTGPGLVVVAIAAMALGMFFAAEKIEAYFRRRKEEGK
jgi:uncharacterized membrane protein YedE/YeeE